MDRSQPIAVVGAGSAGLLLTLLLQRQDHAVTLFERSPQLRDEGCGILLVKAGVEAIAAAGIPDLLEEILAAGIPVQRFLFRKSPTHPPRRWWPTGRSTSNHCHGWCRAAWP